MRTFRPLHPRRNALRSLYRIVSLYWKLILGLVLLMLAEVYIHIQHYKAPRTSIDLDPPFQTGCRHPISNTSARANATFVMLARNKEVEGAVASVRNLQEQFNDHFGYPWVFLNDEEWSDEFKEKVGTVMGKDAQAKFEVIPKGMWGFPEWIDTIKAKRHMDRMQSQNVQYAGLESYHHMCRFQSGFFYDHPAVQTYKWYWRVEPSVSFTCAITYDPFVEMERHNKRYGYVIALWEMRNTIPSLFGKISEYKSRLRIPTTSLWTAMIDPSHVPWPLRRLLTFLDYRDNYGDMYSMCHFWSNFEIADMDFFRSPDYRNLFEFLDKDGGFYYERWGDAPVHTLAAALLLKPEELHHFSDVGYIHDGLQYCTHRPTEEAKKQGYLVPRLDERSEQLGCRCSCDPTVPVLQPVCANRVRHSLG